MKKEYDFSKMKRREKVKVDADAAKVPISIRLDAVVLAELKTMSERLGMPYQTFISSVLFRFVTGDLVDKKDDQIKQEIRSLLREVLKDSGGR
ncbi:BrnA antitoxin family protein [Bdellovibrio bacteriovorus]|uniref:BrnA antitoxin family protein n=1 Tax=Bdellovibrio TaxID=958 RepID=UPI0035A8BDD1